MAEFDVVNSDAVGTFSIREDVSESTMRAAIARQLPFKSDIMICPPKQIVDLMRRDPFSRQPSGPNITRFVNVLHKPLRKRLAFDLLRTSNIEHQRSQLPSLPISLPSDNDWLLKIIAIRGRFVLGLYRRQMKAISYLGRIEKLLAVPATTRNCNPIEKVVKILTS